MVMQMPFSAPSGPVPGMAMTPPPMAAPPPPMDMSLPSPSQPDLMGLLDKLMQTPAQPKYAPGYKRPKKPVKGQILARAEISKRANQPFLDQVADTYDRIRLLRAGYLTEDDRLKRELGRQTPYVSPALVDDWNRFTSYLSSRPVAYSVDVYDPELFGDAQKIEDFSYYLRAKFERSWVERGNMALGQTEAKDLTLFGVLMARITVDLTNTHCPFDFIMVDPATVFPIWGRAGAVKTLESVYRMVTMPAHQVLADYFSDDPPAKVMDALKSSLEATMGDGADVEIVEYWDTWWRGVFINGTDVDIVPITEHKYGCVPYVIQYGPGGEPTHTRHPNESYNPYSEFNRNGDQERTHKSLGYLERKKLPHDQREGFSTKVLEATLRDFDPPVVIESTADGADGYDFPEIDRSPGATSHLQAGQERIGPAVPSSVAMSGGAGLLMQILGQDAKTNMLGEGFSNAAEKSNISGTARSGFAEEGRESQQGWVEAMELFRGRCQGHSVKLWRNFAHLARYGSGKKQSFYIPRRNPGYGESKSYELTPDVIDNVDCDVRCSMNGLRLQELVGFAQAAQMLGPDGLDLWDEHMMAEKAGVTDIQRVRANNRIARNVRASEELPEFKKLIIVPQALMKAAAAAITEGERDALLEQLALWMQMVAQPQQAQMAGMGMPPQGDPGMPPGMPPGAQPVGGIPGGANTAAAQGMMPGPGSGPQGPMDNPSPPPPGSYSITP